MATERDERWEELLQTIADHLHRLNPSLMPGPADSSMFPPSSYRYLVMDTANNLPFVTRLRGPFHAPLPQCYVPETK